MIPPRTLGILACTIVLALAGCMSQPDAPITGAEQVPARERPLLSGTVWTGQDCETGIGVSAIGAMYNDGTLNGLWGNYVGPFEIKDVVEFTRVRVMGIEQMTMLSAPGHGNSTAALHGLSRCFTAQDADGRDLGEVGMGWIAAYIEPPEWGRDGIEHQFFVADWSLTDADLVATVLAGTSPGLELNPALEADIGWPAPNLMHGRIHDSMHGLYEWQTLQLPAEPLPTRTLRFWMLVHESDATPPSYFGVSTHGLRKEAGPHNENGGNGEIEGRHYPIAVDVTMEAIPGQAQIRYPAESTGNFHHVEYCHHGYPEAAEHDGHQPDPDCQDTPEKFEGDADAFWTDGLQEQTEAGLHWSGYRTTVAMGPDYRDHWFDVTWIH